MERIKIDMYISDLLYRYDCVIVPDFGGFIANYSSAKIQSVQGKIIPPSKVISFNKNLTTNDGLLTSHVAERKFIPYEEAKKLIQSFVAQSIEGLNQGDRIHIEKIGALYLDAEGKIQFTPEEKNDFLLESFGLNTLKVQAIDRKVEESVDESLKKVIPLIQKEVEKKKRKYWPAAAALALLLFSSYLLNKQYAWLDAPSMNYSGFNFEESVAPLYKIHISDLDVSKSFVLENSKPVFESNALSPLRLANEVETSIMVDTREEITLEEDNTAVALEVPKEAIYHVMGGCFSVISNAEGLVGKLVQKGFNARLLGEYKNLHAVSYASFTNREEALKLLAAVKSEENPSAWLLVKSF